MKDISWQALKTSEDRGFQEKFYRKESFICASYLAEHLPNNNEFYYSEGVIYCAKEGGCLKIDSVKGQQIYELIFKTKITERKKCGASYNSFFNDSMTSLLQSRDLYLAFIGVLLLSFKSRSLEQLLNHLIFGMLEIASRWRSWTPKWGRLVSERASGR